MSRSGTASAPVPAAGTPAGRAGATASEGTAVLPRREWPSALGFSGVWLVTFGFAIAVLVPRVLDPDAADRGAAIAGLAAVAVFVPVYLIAFVVPRPLPGRPAWAGTLLYTAVLTGCLTVLSGALGVMALLYAMFLMALWVFPHPMRLAVLGTVGTAAVTAAVALTLYPTDARRTAVLAYLAVGAAVMLVIRLAVGREEQLTDMRQELALAGQRERLARDLHDILGHSLTAINVKAQLVERLIAADPDRARAEASEVVALSRAALTEARSAVTDLAVPRLGAQLSESVGALRDQGIAVEAPPHGAVAEVPEARRALAAWSLREAVTNVLRHARASRVRILLDAGHVAVHDDGTGLPAGGAGPRTLAARAADAGARLEVGPGLDGRGTAVAVRWAAVDEERGRA